MSLQVGNISTEQTRSTEVDSHVVKVADKIQVGQDLNIENAHGKVEICASNDKLYIYIVENGVATKGAELVLDELPNGST